MSISLSRTWRRLRFGEAIVVVSGLPRSGTSMAMKMLAAGGLPILTDGLRSADDDNPKGYFEVERVKDLEKEADKAWLGEARGKAIKVISFLLKDLPASFNYKVVFMRRDLSEVLASQAKMLAHRGEASEADDARLREIYEGHLWRAAYLLRHGSHFESITVDYRTALADPRREAGRINGFLGGRLAVEAMVDAVDEALYRNRAG